MTQSLPNNLTNPFHKRVVRQDISRQLDDNNETEIILSDVYQDQIQAYPHADQYVPEFVSQLRHRLITVPEEAYQATGINIFGKRFKTFLFSTDIALIRNSNAQAVFGVYPFTPLEAIMRALVDVSSVPVFLGVGGGVTSGQRSINLAFQAEQLGAYGVIVNAPMPNEVIREINTVIDIPVIATIPTLEDDYLGKLKAGVDILNVSGGANTADMVRHIRQEVGPEVPIIATGGPVGQTVKETIEAGANAITYTPPTSAEIFKEIMVGYRSKGETNH